MPLKNPCTARPIYTYSISLKGDVKGTKLLSTQSDTYIMNRTMKIGIFQLVLLYAHVKRVLLVEVQSSSHSHVYQDTTTRMYSTVPEGLEITPCVISFSHQPVCTAEFTQHLSMATITDINGFHWNRWRSVLDLWRFFIKFECVYHYSPNVAHWQSETFLSAFNCAPICKEFCDNWFTALCWQYELHQPLDNWLGYD